MTIRLDSRIWRAERDKKIEEEMERLGLNRDLLMQYDCNDVLTDVIMSGTKADTLSMSQEPDVQIYVANNYGQYHHGEAIYQVLHEADLRSFTLCHCKGHYVG